MATGNQRVLSKSHEPEQRSTAISLLESKIMIIPLDIVLFNLLHILTRFLFVWRFSETVNNVNNVNNANNVNNVNNGFLPIMHKLSVVTTAHVQLTVC